MSTVSIFLSYKLHCLLHQYVHPVVDITACLIFLRVAHRFLTLHNRGLNSSNKLNCFPHEYIWDEYPSTISILPYTWNNDVFRDKKGFWCIKITNQIISLLKGYTNLVKEHSFLHSLLHVRPFMNIHPHQIRICEYLSTRITLLILKNIAPSEGGGELNSL